MYQNSSYILENTDSLTVKPQQYFTLQPLFLPLTVREANLKWISYADAQGYALFPTLPMRKRLIVWRKASVFTPQIEAWAQWRKIAV